MMGDRRGVMIEGKETRLNENLKTGLFYDNNPYVSGILMSKKPQMMISKTLSIDLILDIPMLYEVYFYLLRP